MVKKLKANGPDPPDQLYQQQQLQQQQQQQQQEQQQQEHWLEREFNIFFNNPQQTPQEPRHSLSRQTTPQVQEISPQQAAQVNQSQQVGLQANQPSFQISQLPSTLPVFTYPQSSSTGTSIQHLPNAAISLSIPLQQQCNGQNQPSFRPQNSGQQPVPDNSTALAQSAPRPGGSRAIYIPDRTGGPRAGSCSEQWRVPQVMNATSPIFPQVCGKVDGDFVGLFDHVIRGDEPEQPQGPPVAQFPQRNSLPGRYDLKVDFPRDSPKFIVREIEGGRRRIYTLMDNNNTVIIRHSADSRASLRFLIVFSHDSEATQPVLPCKNHQNEHHPHHMLEVFSGHGDSKWEFEYHPSIVVTPAPTAQGEYNVQLKFLCRNSCLTRKDLVLICQLERDGQVLGRECLDVKVSACPRRDASRPSGNPPPHKMLRGDRSQGGHQDVGSNLFEAMDAVPIPAPGIPAPGIPAPGIPAPGIPAPVASAVSAEALRQALESASNVARLFFIVQRFKELHPEEYEDIKTQFNTFWDSRMQK
ncbi:uncharacterized protein LOC122256222 [Penaeus japonicus]|uniref:uncharacterized protein LOC122256222 n=1 Tax=Penaeus japonicus TaxID=27405 RepID=UPI001C713349|nr:uncharacterized protein LOC122256222 [Penaeus japonicus]XP_042876694.1 uncharacterized protein LOC122256222 [Penaeus japonicus]